MAQNISDQLAASPETGYAFPGLDKLHNDIYPAISVAATPSLRQPGKVVLITGAGRGCGRSMALQYAHAEVASIILVSRTTMQLDEVEQSIRTINPDVCVRKFAVDVTDEEAVAACAEAVKKEEGRLDILINNAGSVEPTLPLTDSNPKTWWRTYEINVKGPYLFLHALLPLLIETAEKNKTVVDVINVTSIGALTTTPGLSGYQSTKVALQRLTEFVSVEYGAKGVNAVGLHPGSVPTDLANTIEVIAPFLIDTPDLSGGCAVWLTKGQRTWLGGRYVSATWDVDKLESMQEEIVKGDKLKLKLVV